MSQYEISIDVTDEQLDELRREMIQTRTPMPVTAALLGALEDAANRPYTPNRYRELTKGMK